MSQRAGCSPCEHTWATRALFLAGMFATLALPAEPRLVADLRAGRDYQGPVYSIAFEGARAWMATREKLYKVQDGRARVVDVAAGKYDRLALAPGGGIYARLVTGGVPGGLFRVQLVTIPQGREVGELRLTNLPFGAGELYLGGAGQLIVTVTPLDDREGLGGRFQYVFWSREGKKLSEIVLDGLRTGVVDAAGKALLLLGEKDAITLNNEGSKLWSLDGSFRNGALGKDGDVALLNPAQENAIDEVHVVWDRRATTPIKMRSTVYDLALAADGSVGAIAIDKGELFFVSPTSCREAQCTLKAVRQFVHPNFLISAIRFVDAKTVAVGVIQHLGAGNWPRAAAFAVNTTSGDVLFKSNDIPLEQPAMWSPSIDASYGVPFFAAYTPHRALLVSVDR